MQILHGSSRLAFVGEQTTIKIPHPRNIMNAFNPYAYLPSKKMKGGTGEWELRGITANIREGEDSARFPGVVVPTRTHLSGLLSVQPTTEDLALTPDKVDLLLRDHLGTSVWERNQNHTFTNPDNYGIRNKRVLIRDFGGDGMRDYLEENRSRVIDLLDKMTRITEGSVPEGALGGLTKETFAVKLPASILEQLQRQRMEME